jgi:hypothetical protein
MEAKTNEENNKKVEKEQKQQIQQQTANNKLSTLYQRYVKNQQLSADDLCNLLRKVKHRNDKPIATKMAKLQQQWEEQKYRLDAFFPNPQQVVGVVPTDIPDQVGQI